MVMWHMPIAMAPSARTGFRPNLSMYKMAGMVAKNMTIPTTPVARREVVFDERPREPKIWGA